MVHESRENERAEGEEGDVCNDDVDSDGRYKARTRTRRWNTGSVVCRQWYCRFVFTVQYSKVYYIIIVISIIISIIMLFFCFAYATAFLQQVACPCTCPYLPFLALPCPFILSRAPLANVIWARAARSRHRDHRNPPAEDPSLGIVPHDSTIRLILPPRLVTPRLLQDYSKTTPRLHHSTTPTADRAHHLHLQTLDPVEEVTPM